MKHRSRLAVIALVLAGAGIGLALAKRIAEVPSERVGFESDGSGHGSTLCFTLPRSGKIPREEK